MRYTLIAVIAVAVLFQTGCFSALNRSAGSWTGDTSVSPQAVALDVATAPVQAPFWIIAGVGHALSGNRAEQQSKFRDSFVRSEDFRREFIYSPKLTAQNLDFLMDEEMVRLLTEQDVRHLWIRFKGVAMGVRHALLIAPAATPQDVLGEYYRSVLDQAQRREGRPYPQELTLHPNLLFHPNLPDSIIAEIRSFSIESLEKMLNGRRG